MTIPRSWLALSLVAACTSEGQLAQTIDPPFTVPSEALAIRECETPAGGDGYSLGDVFANGDELIAQVAFSGGCAAHDFAVCWNGVVADSYPPQLGLAVGHNGHRDACEGWIQTELRIDLTRILDRPVTIHVTGASSQMPGTTASVTIPK